MNSVFSGKEKLNIEEISTGEMIFKTTMEIASNIEGGYEIEWY